MFRKGRYEHLPISFRAIKVESLDLFFKLPRYVDASLLLVLDQGIFLGVSKDGARVVSAHIDEQVVQLPHSGKFRQSARNSNLSGTQRIGNNYANDTKYDLKGIWVS